MRRFWRPHRTFFIGFADISDIMTSLCLGYHPYWHYDIYAIINNLTNYGINSDKPAFSVSKFSANSDIFDIAMSE